MEIKDFLLVCIPIVFEGIIIFYVQTWITRRLADMDRKRLVRDLVVSDFLKRLIDIKYERLKLTVEATNDSEYTIRIQNLLNKIKETGLIYEANTYDLECFHKEFDEYYNSWLNLVDVWNKAASGVQTEEKRKKVYDQGQICIAKTDDLIEAVRSKY